tara:strand:- start:313 stop:1473 length:1161 start_codon:yes stop_codon:yes gene_type:complete
MASNLRVDNIQPTTGTGIGIGTANGSVTINNDLVVVGNQDVTGIVTATTFSGDVTDGALSSITSISTTNLTVNGNAYPSAGSLSHRNYVINGAFNRWERGTSFTANSAVTFGADRFAAYNASSSTNAYTRSTDVPANQGFTYSGSFHNIDIRHSIELPGDTLRGQFIDGSQWTLSFWVKAGSSGTGTVNAGWGDGVAANQLTYWGAGKNYTYSTSWEKKEITFTVANNLVAGDVAILLYWGAVADQKITGVQFEKGAVASPFEFLHPADELARCQRYYQKIVNSSGNSSRTVILGSYTTTRAFGGVPLSVPMRTSSPDLTQNSLYLELINLSNSFAVTSIGRYGNMGNGGGVMGVEANVASGLSGGTMYYLTFVGTGSYLALEAEL